MGKGKLIDEIFGKFCEGMDYLPKLFHLVSFWRKHDKTHSALRRHHFYEPQWPHESRHYLSNNYTIDNI
mgnify:CR=1 FL=1